MLCPAPLHGAENSQQVRLFIDVPHELAAGAVPGVEAQLLQVVQKLPALPVSLLSRVDHGTVKVFPFTVRPEQGQLVPGEAVHRGSQCGDEGHVLPGIVHNLEDGQGHIDLGCLEEVLPPVGGPGNSRLAEGLEVVVKHRAGAAQEDHHVRRPQRPEAVPLLHHQGLIQHFPDSPGREPGLQQIFVPLLPLLLPQEGQVDGVQLQSVGVGGTAGLRLGDKGLSRRQRLVAGVIQLAKFS